MVKYAFKLPDLGEGTTKAEIVRWHVAAGDVVREDQPLVDVMTDKATMEIPSPVTGTVTALYGEPGDTRPVGADLIDFDIGGGKPAAGDRTKDETSSATARPAAPSAESRAAAPSPPTPAQLEKPTASPAVRRRAAELGVGLADVPATGPGGRVLREDLEAFVAGHEKAKARPPTPSPGDFEEIKVIGLRRAIAERMADAKRRIPHITYVEEIDVEALEDLRAELNSRPRSDGLRLTILPFLMRAIVRAAARYPQCNALFDDGAGVIRRSRAAHIGIATQTPSGLMVPVVRNVERLDLWASAREVQRLAERAREGKATRAELTGSTITISSLGSLGGVVSTPVINAPEVAIVGVNRVVERPVVRRGQVVARRMMNLSSSFDHRVVDGWDAASFIQVVKSFLETPATMFIEEGR
ncbi:MAG TPA: dihydrolipoamide acetyltransferase family protein [Roseiarcus sp.]|nr:dihydrolipoamide acetyltransferase family protein [Roseiarcus sp.]